MQRRSATLEQLQTNLNNALKMNNSLESLQVQLVSLQKSLYDVVFLSTFSANVINNLLLI